MNAIIHSFCTFRQPLILFMKMQHSILTIPASFLMFNAFLSKCKSRMIYKRFLSQWSFIKYLINTPNLSDQNIIISKGDGISPLVSY